MLAGETVVDSYFFQGEKLITQMETSSSQTPGVSVPNTHSAALASAARPVRHKRAAQDAALGPTKEEKASPFSHGEPHAKRLSSIMRTEGLHYF